MLFRPTVQWFCFEALLTLKKEPLGINRNITGHLAPVLEATFFSTPKSHYCLRESEMKVFEREQGSQKPPGREPKHSC